MALLLSRWLGFLVEPATVLTALILATAAAALFRRRRAVNLLVALATAMVLAIAVLPIPRWLALPLEERFAQDPPLPAQIDGIIVLGGTERVELSAARRQPTLSDPTPIEAWIALGRRFPNATLVFSGGEHAQDDPAVGEASIVQDFLNQLGVGHGVVTFEDRSRNTHENATLTYDLVKPKPGQHWILVTQAIAMPRAVGAFRKAGWSVIAFPAGYLTRGRQGSWFSLDLLGGLAVSATAMHEWVGLLFYRFMGYSDAMFPG